jgi:hypothetical protein
MQNSLKRYELLELVIPPNYGASRINYPDIPQLRDDTTQDIIIRGIETFSIEAMPLSAQGGVVATTVQLQNAFLTLYVDGEESVRRIPLIRLNNMFQAAAAGTSFQEFERTELENLKIDWNKTYIEFAQPPNTGGANAQFSIMLGVIYKKLPPGTWDKLIKNQIKGM